MKVLLLGSKEYPFGSNKGEDKTPSGGIERSVATLAQALTHSGKLELILITRKFKGVSKFEHSNALTVHRVNWSNGRILRHLTFNFNSFFKALSLDFDVIHANGQVTGLFGVLLKIIKGKPLVYSPHGLAHMQPQHGFFTKLFFKISTKLIHAFADKVIFLSEGEKRNYLQITPGVKAAIIPHIFELNEFAKHEKAKRHATPVVCFIGRLSKVKGVDLLLKAVAPLECRLLIAGDGPERNKLELLVSELKIESKVKFMGNVGNVLSVFSQSDVFVLPSYSEGFPVTILEAAAAKVPIVATDIGLELTNEETALIVQPGDVSALRKAITRLFTDSKLVSKLTKNAYVNLTQYSKENITSQYEKLYVNLRK